MHLRAAYGNILYVQHGARETYGLRFAKCDYLFSWQNCKV